MQLSNLLIAYNYAALRGIKPEAVYKSIYRGSIKPIIIDGLRFIDKEQYPLNERISSLNPINKNDTEYYGKAEGIDIKNLKSAKGYAKQAQTQIHKVYEAIIAGNLKPIIINGIAFIDITQYPAANFHSPLIR